MAFACDGVCLRTPARSLFRSRRRGHPRALRLAATTRGFHADHPQQWVQPAQQNGTNGSGERLLEEGSTEGLQSAILQLQADNSELQAEIQHLAATLRAALATTPDCAGGSSGTLDTVDYQNAYEQYQMPCQDSDDLLQQLQTFEQHDHAHLHANGGSWHAGDTAAGAAMLAGMDPPSAAAPVYHQPTSVSQATLTCSMQHPGSLCCSKLSSSVDPGGAACTVSLHTTARCTADGVTVSRHLAPEELKALAAQALVGAAHAFSQTATAEYREAMAAPQEAAARHADLCQVLEKGLVVCAERTPPSQFDHKSYLLTLQDPNTAMRVRAIYKPRVYGDAGGWHRTPMEWVAYRLNLLLGLDLVPPVAYRTAPLSLSLSDEEEELCFAEGAMMLWVEGCALLKEFPQHEWGVDPSLLLSDTRVLDVLLHNSDRHHGHFLLGPHWAQGRERGGHWEGARRPVLIDHAASFRKEAVVSMEHENAFGSGAVRCVSASTYLRLRFLDSHTVAQELGQHLSRAEQRQLLHRRDYILQYFDRLVASQGYAATVRE